MFSLFWTIHSFGSFATIEKLKANFMLFVTHFNKYLARCSHSISLWLWCRDVQEHRIQICWNYAEKTSFAYAIICSQDASSESDISIANQWRMAHLVTWSNYDMEAYLLPETNKNISWSTFFSSFPWKINKNSVHE